MSFSRAKVQRFNEIQSSTPSPADYNLPQKTRTVSIVSISTTTEKCSDNASVISNESSSCFRTPTLIRKKKVTKQAKPTKLFDENDDEMLQEKIVECNNKDGYIKDLTEQIEDLKTQLADLNVQKADLEHEKKQYENNLNEIKKKQGAHVDDLASAHSCKMDSLKTLLKQRSFEFATLKEQYILMKEEHKASLEQLLKDINEMGEEFNVKVTKVYQEEITSRENRLKEKQSEIDQLNEEIRITEEKNAEDIENLSRLHKKQVSEIELQMLTIITNSERTLDEVKKSHEMRISKIENVKNQEINELKSNHSVQIASLLEQKELDINQIREEYKISKEEVDQRTKQHVEEVETVWKNTFKEQEIEANERLKTYQEESESKIIEIEIEKNRRKQELLELKQELEQLQTEADIAQKYEELQDNYNKEIIDLQSRCKDLELQKTKLGDELAELISTSHTYQVTLQKTRETVSTISKRLLDSDHDVEKLKKELEICEARKLNLEEECNIYQDQMEVLIKANAELEERQEEVVEVYRKELRAVKTEIKNKTDSYKTFTDDITKKHQNRLQQKQLELNETKEQLDLQQKQSLEVGQLTVNANTKISFLENMNADLKEQLDELIVELKQKKEHITTLSAQKQQLAERLQSEEENNEKLKCELSNINETDLDGLRNELAAMQRKCESSQQYSEYYKSKVEEYEKEVEDTEKIRKNYNEQSKNYEELSQRFHVIQEDKKRLEKKLEENNLLIGPYRKQLEAFEYERNLLLSQKSDAEVEALTMSIKYAEILGHQNQKQKIKHMVDLKEKNRELEKVNKNLEAKMRSQTKTIEKLKKELTARNRTPNMKLMPSDKENIINSPCDYNVTASPLHDRN